MIRNLSQKAQDEKYFKSIRYFSHSIKGETRRGFIEELSEHNVYLAAQCIMSSEEDIMLEDRLVTKAQVFAKDFKNTKNSANGFLALAEFGSFETIFSLFSSIKNPSSTHIQVFSKILESNDPDVFCSFLSVLVKTNKNLLIQFAINAYNGELPLTASVREQIKLVINYLVGAKMFGIINMLVSKFNLYSDYHYILNEKIETIIENLIRQKFKGLKLAFELTEEHELFQQFPFETFITNAASIGGKKPLVFAMTLANQREIKNIKEINRAISGMLKSTRKTTLQALNNVPKPIILKYLEGNNVLLAELEQLYENNLKPKKERRISLTPILNRLDNNVSAELREVYNADMGLSWSLKTLFENNLNVQINSFIEYIIDNEIASYTELSRELSMYNFTGIVNKVRDYGAYIKCKQLGSRTLLFLHMNKVADIMAPDLREVLYSGDSIKFRVIGIRPDPLRLNIQCLQILGQASVN